MAARLEAMGKRGLFLTAESLMADTAANLLMARARAIGAKAESRI
jgi:hypothetical protein